MGARCKTGLLILSRSDVLKPSCPLVSIKFPAVYSPEIAKKVIAMDLGSVQLIFWRMKMSVLRGSVQEVCTRGMTGKLLIWWMFQNSRQEGDV